jgi:hypothetical protein
MAERIRSNRVIYKSGVDLTVSITTNVGTPDNVELDTTSGVIFQMHKQTIALKDMSTGDTALVVNDSTTPYTSVSDLNSLLTDSAGVSMSGKYFNLVLWMVANKPGEFSPYMINLPSGSYNTLSAAQADTDGYDNFSIPPAFTTDSSTGFLVARLTFQHSVASGGTWTHHDTIDLRGSTPSIAVGGGTGTVQVEFSDNAFRIFDDVDSTKEMVRLVRSRWMMPTSTWERISFERMALLHLRPTGLPGVLISRARTSP